MKPSNTDCSSHAGSLTETLTQSRVFQDYQSAFENATGLPLHLHAKGGAGGGLALRPAGNPFCLLMAKSNHACAACFALQQKVEQESGMEPRSLHCFAGLCESAVPVRVGEKIIAFLQTGQILLHRPDAKCFSKVAQTLLELGTEIDLKKAEEAWFATTVLSEKQYEAMLRLLHIFAGHLSVCASALQLDSSSVEPTSIKKAKAIVRANFADEISLGKVAKAVNVSAGYFSDLFHKATGLTFTEYVSRVRIEKVKNLLRNPHLQITAIAYDTGFKSLSQFNRVFRQICGVSPREYRSELTATADT
jgi:AraC-like DNA-binding protein/ligand-binding sensor protein